MLYLVWLYSCGIPAITYPSLHHIHQHHRPTSKTAIIDCYAPAMYTGTTRPPLQHMPSACWHAPTGKPTIRPRHAWGATGTTALLLMNVELTIDTSLLEEEYSTPPLLPCTKTTAAHTALHYKPLLDMSAMPCSLKRRASSVWFITCQPTPHLYNTRVMGHYTVCFQIDGLSYICYDISDTSYVPWLYQLQHISYSSCMICWSCYVGYGILAQTYRLHRTHLFQHVRYTISALEY